MGHVTQKEIAEALNLSRVTVTKALKDHPDLAKSTIKKVKDFAREKGYIPNLVSRNLSTRHTRTIGFVVPKLFNSFCSSAIEAAHECAIEKEYQVIPMLSYENPLLEKKAIETLLASRVDGIVIDISEKTTNMEIFHRLKDQDIPLLFIDRFIEGEPFNRVVTNDREAAAIATRHLFDNGCTSIGFLGISRKLNIGNQRLLGFREAMDNAGIKIDEKMVLEGDISIDFGYKTLKKFHQQKKVPDALVCASLSVAVGVHKACRELGLDIPNDLSLVSFGDMEMSSLLTPSLTIMHVPIRKMAKHAIEYIIKQGEDENFRIPEEKVYKSKLHLGESTKK
jgi:LacI family transcriptional regulator